LRYNVYFKKETDGSYKAGTAKLLKATAANKDPAQMTFAKQVALA